MSICVLKLILFLLLFFRTFEVESILAIEKKFPFRNGKIFVVLASNGYELHNLSPQYFLQLPTDPVQVIVIPRTIQISNTTCNKIDYSLTTSSVTKTGFNLQIILSQTYNIFYSRLVLDYFAVSIFTNNADKFFIYNPFPLTNVKNSFTFTTVYKQWKWSQPGITYMNENQFSLILIPQQFIAYFPTNHFYMKTYKNVDLFSNAITVGFQFRINVQIIKLLPSGFIFHYSTEPFMKNFTQYIFFVALVIFDNSYSIVNLQNTPIVNTIVGIYQIQTYSSISNKFDISFEYSPEFETDTSYQYVQNNIKETLFKKQTMSQQIVAFYSYYGRKNCTSNSVHKLIDFAAQLCYDECPSKMYQQTIQCKRCLKCTNINTCLICFQNTCEDGTVFDTTSIPYKCSTCQSKITNCQTCFANQTGVFCTLCNPLLNFGLSANYKNCIACTSDSFHNTTSGFCNLCTSIFDNCQACSIGGTHCNSCTLVSKTELVNGICQPCNSTSFYYSSNKTCILCSSVSSNCETCVYNSSLTVNCTSCNVASKTMLQNEQCIPCSSNQYYNPNTLSCHLCDTLIPNCEQCSSSSIISCTKCSIATETMLDEGICRDCLSYQYWSINDSICVLCSNLIPNCIQCMMDPVLQILSCSLCNSSELVQFVDGLCISCNSSAYFDTIDNICHTCSDNCIQCFSFTICIQCVSNASIKSKLVNGFCDSCNIKQNHQNGLSICTSNMCTFSTYNPETQKCEQNAQIQTVAESLTVIASIPTISLFTKALSVLTALLDDLSYYSYHKRKYSEEVEYFFSQMTNYTLAKFIPFQLNINLDNFQYRSLILKRSLNKTPQQFSQIDKDIYFINNTQQIWILDLPITLLMFIILYFFHCLINKFTKNKTLKSYCYFWGVLVTIIGDNIQYFSFRIFSQFYQFVPISFWYYFNLIATYFILFVVLIYCLSSFQLFLLIYKDIKQSYILKQIFSQTWLTWFIVLNITKILTGFIHAYFYYHPLLQTSLLALAYFIKFITYVFSLKHFQDKFEYSFEFCSYVMMFVLQCFFVGQSLQIEYGLDQVIILQYFGKQESLIIFTMIIGLILYIFILIIKLIITIILPISKTELCKEQRKIRNPNFYLRKLHIFNPIQNQSNSDKLLNYKKPKNRYKKMKLQQKKELVYSYFQLQNNSQQRKLPKLKTKTYHKKSYLKKIQQYHNKYSTIKQFNRQTEDLNKTKSKNIIILKQASFKNT